MHGFTFGETEGECWGKRVFFKANGVTLTECQCNWYAILALTSDKKQQYDFQILQFVKKCNRKKNQEKGKYWWICFFSFLFGAVCFLLEVLMVAQTEMLYNIGKKCKWKMENSFLFGNHTRKVVKVLICWFYFFNMFLIELWKLKMRFPVFHY